MKRYITLSLIATLAFGMVSCTKEAPVEDNTVPGTSFTIYASTPDTKTVVNDDMNGVEWAAGDAMNIFHAQAGTTKYASDGSFTFTEGTKFNGTVNGELSEVNDWYAIYPYKEQITTPASKEGGYQYIGSRSDKSQTQNGNNSMAHLAGSNIPLYGVAEGVDSEDTPSFSMKQLVSVVAINVTNETKKPLSVANISFKATESIVGAYYIDFTGEEIKYTENSNPAFISNVASLSVFNAEELEENESAVFYIAIKPFSAKSGSTLSVSVNGYSKDIELTKDITFTAGKIKKINFGYDSTVSTYTWNLAVDSTSEATDQKLSWTSDYATMVVEKGGASTNANNYYPGTPDKDYASTRMYKNSILSIAAKESYVIKKVIFEATTDGYTTALVNSTWTNAKASYENHTVTVNPVFGDEEISAVMSNTTGLTSVTVFYDDAPANPLPVISVSSTLDIPFKNAAGTITPTYKHTEDVSVEVYSDMDKTESCGWFDADVNDDLSIEYLASDNDGAERIAYLFISAINSNTDITEQMVTVTQAAKSEITVLYTLDTTLDANKGTNSGYATNGDVTVGGITWNATGNMTMAPWRLGGKSITSVDREVYTKTAYSAPLTSIKLTLGSASSVTINSIELVYSTSSDFSNSKTLAADSNKADTTHSFEPQGGFPANCYFKFVLNLTISNTSNKFVEFSKVEFIGSSN